MRSRWTRSIITASDLGSTASRSYDTSQGHLSTPTGTSVGGATRVTSAPRVCSSRTLERATRLCRTSPTIVTRTPSSRPSRCRIVYAASSACVGCSCVPSPALTTLPRTQCASRCGAPLALCRTTIASLPIASSVSAVSLRLSPLLTLDPFAEKLITSADSRLAASSKEIRVRVESSKKRLTTVRPRSVGSFFTSRPASAESICAAVSRTSVASARSRSPVSSSCRLTVSPVRFRGRSAPRSQSSLRCSLPVASPGLLREQDLVGAVDLGEVHAHLLGARGGHVLADVVGADRQLPVASVDQDRELHRPRPAEVAQRVQRRADRAPGVQDVVDEDDEPAVDARARQHRGLQRADPAQPQVVAVERDVDGADVDRGAGERLDAPGEPTGERGAAGGDADQHEVAEPGCDITYPAVPSALLDP